jgi:hypothetical protein
LFPQAPKPLLAASLQLGVIVVAGTASLALLYLLWRRNKDNFGRDYYRYTMSRLAAGAYVLPLLVLGPLTLALSPTNELTRSTIRPQCLITLGTGLLCSLVGLVLARRIHNSQSPMRHKISLLALALLVWLSTSAFFVGYLSLAWPEFQPLSSF